MENALSRNVEVSASKILDVIKEADDFGYMDISLVKSSIRSDQWMKLATERQANKQMPGKTKPPWQK